LYVSPTFPPSAHAQAALTKLTAGTNPIHNKKPKKKVVEEDDEDKAYKLKAAAGTLFATRSGYERPQAGADGLRQTRRLARSWPRRLAARVL
jgi:hypothetical protein